jgi:hypothetical protein
MPARVFAYMLADDGGAPTHRAADGGQGARTREESRALPGP